MTTVADICGIIAKLAPPETAADGDNTGLLIGRKDAAVSRVLCALDVTDAVIDEAVSLGAQMIVSHHPLIYGAISKINDGSRLGRAVLQLIENKIAVYAAHTELDMAAGGTNDCLAERLGLCNVKPLVLEDGSKPVVGRCGELAVSTALAEFAAFTAERIGIKLIRYTGSAESRISRVAVCTGSGNSVGYFKKAAEDGCDCFVSGDLTYHKAQAAAEMGLCLIDATHFATEILIAEKLRNYIQSEADKKGYAVTVTASAVETNIFAYT
jgi:dinuclear metal center YbgI/SA1388 family protein